PMAAAEQDLLFGLLALQNGLIDQNQLVAAFRSWTCDKAKPLASHLQALGHLDGDGCAAVSAMVAFHLKKHGADPDRSLPALATGQSMRHLLQAVGDPKLTGTMAHLGSGSTELDRDGDEHAADRTATYHAGDATGDGQRFRILRPHARGGLGAVFVARDE